MKQMNVDNNKYLKILFFFLLFYKSSFAQLGPTKEISTNYLIESQSPSIRLSDSLICAGEAIYISLTPTPDSYNYLFEAINSTTNEVTYLNIISKTASTYTRFGIDTKTLSEITQTQIYKIRLSVYGYYNNLLETVILDQKLIINPTPKLSLNFRETQTDDDRTLGDLIPINFIRTRGKLPFSYIIDDTLKVNMPVDTFTYMYNRKTSNHYILDALTDANGCTNTIDYYSHTGSYTDYQVFPKINERRVIDGLNASKFFCKSEVMEVRLKIKGIVPPHVTFIPKYRSYYNSYWQNLPVILDSAGIYLIQLPNNIEPGTYILTFEPNDSKYSVDLGYEFEDRFEIVERIKGLIYSNGDIKINKNEAFSLKVALNGRGLNPTSINYYEVILKTNFGNRIKINMHLLDNYVRIDTLTRTTTFFIESIKLKGKENKRFEFCESSILEGQVTVEVFDRGSKDINITYAYVLGNNCSNRKIRVEYAPIGINSTIDFKIQLKALYSSYEDESAFIDIPTTTYSNNTLEGVLPFDTLYNSYEVRVVSVSNNLYGQKYYASIFNLGQPPVFQISGEAFVTPNQTPSFYVMNTKGGFDGYYYSVAFTSNGYNWSFPSLRYEAKNEFFLPLPPNLTSLQNFVIAANGISGGSCGNVAFTGSVKINVVQNSPIQISLTSNPIVCEGKMFYFNYNLGNVFTKSNTYKVRYTKVGNPSVIVYSQPINLYTQTGQGYGIYGTGVGIPFELDTDYYVYLVSENPFAISEPILIHTVAYPKISENNNAASADLFEEGIVEQNLHFYGTPPFKIKYFDGDFTREFTANTHDYLFRPYNNFSNTRSLKDSRYKIKIKSIEDAHCLSYEPFYANFTYSSNYFLPKTQAPIIIFPPNKLEVCQGATVRFPFKKDNSVSNIVLQFYHPTEKVFYDLNTFIGADTIVLNAIQNIPTNKPIFFRIKGIKDNQIVFSTSTHNFITFFDSAIAPTATLVSQTLAYKTDIQDFSLKVDFTGSAPWTLNYSLNGKRKEITTDTSPYYLKVNTGYNQYSHIIVLNNAKNACGVGSAIGTVRLIRANFDAYPEVNYYENLCKLSKVDFTIVGVGNFPNNTKLYFVSENLDKPDNVYEVPFTRKGGNLVEVTIPEYLPSGIDKNHPKTYKIRAVCTSPTLEGDFFKLYNNEVLKVNLWGVKPIVTVTGSKTIVKGDSAIIMFSMDKYVEGTSFTFNNWTYNFYDKTYEMIVKPTKDTTFTLTSASHPVCGADIGNPAEAIITVRLCPLELNLNNDINGIAKKYQAGKIEALNKLLNNARIDYNGEKSVLLMPGFESTQGSIFKAQITPCINQNLP